MGDPRRRNSPAPKPFLVREFVGTPEVTERF